MRNVVKMNELWYFFNGSRTTFEHFCVHLSSEFHFRCYNSLGYDYIWPFIFLSSSLICHRLMVTWNKFYKKLVLKSGTDYWPHRHNWPSEPDTVIFFPHVRISSIFCQASFYCPFAFFFFYFIPLTGSHYLMFLT